MLSLSVKSIVGIPDTNGGDNRVMERTSAEELIHADTPWFYFFKTIFAFFSMYKKYCPLLFLMLDLTHLSY